MPNLQNTYHHSTAFSTDLNDDGLPLRKLCMLCRASNAVPNEIKCINRTCRKIIMYGYHYCIYTHRHISFKYLQQHQSLPVQ